MGKHSRTTTHSTRTKRASFAALAGAVLITGVGAAAHVTAPSAGTSTTTAPLADDGSAVVPAASLVIPPAQNAAARRTAVTTDRPSTPHTRRHPKTRHHRSGGRSTPAPAGNRGTEPSAAPSRPAATEPTNPVVPPTKPVTPPPAPVVPPKPAPPTVSMMSFNVCGAACHGGEVNPIASYVADTAARRNARIVMLQELCYTQFRRVRTLMERQGYTAFFAKSTSAGACDNDDEDHGADFGVALLVRGNAWGRVVKALPTTVGVEKRVMLGVTTTIAGRATFVAVVHLSPTAGAGLNGQLATVAAYLNAKAPQPVIVGGDFNAMPDNPGLARFYSPRAGGAGRFTEADERAYGTPSRSGKPTFDVGGRKIDYIFASAAHFGSPHADSPQTTMSDHHVYLGTMRAILS